MRRKGFCHDCLTLVRWNGGRGLPSSLSFGAVLLAILLGADRDIRIVPVVHDGRTLYSNSWALVVGINDYKAPGSDLSYAVNDARAVADRLEALGFENVITLYDSQATKEAIERKLETEMNARMKTNDRLVVFFSGHGATFRPAWGSVEGYLLPYDAESTRPLETGLSMEELHKIANHLNPKHILFVIDACYSGLATSKAAPPPPKLDDPYLQLITSSRAVQILTAGGADEKALEEGGNGLFTRLFLDGLRGLADLTNDGLITARELHVWLDSKVTERAALSGATQRPRFGDFGTTGEFVFVVGKGDAVAATEEALARLLAGEVRSASLACLRVRPDDPQLRLPQRVQEEFVAAATATNERLLCDELDAATSCLDLAALMKPDDSRVLGARGRIKGKREECKKREGEQRRPDLPPIIFP